jgi:hypothetical protein
MATAPSSRLAPTQHEIQKADDLQKPLYFMLKIEHTHDEFNKKLHLVSIETLFLPRLDVINTVIDGEMDRCQTNLDAAAAYRLNPKRGTGKGPGTRLGVAGTQRWPE